VEIKLQLHGSSFALEILSTKRNKRVSHTERITYACLVNFWITTEFLYSKNKYSAIHLVRWNKQWRVCKIGMHHVNICVGSKTFNLFVRMQAINRFVGEWHIWMFTIHSEKIAWHPITSIAICIYIESIMQEFKVFQKNIDFSKIVTLITYNGAVVNTVFCSALTY